MLERINEGPEAVELYTASDGYNDEKVVRVTHSAAAPAAAGKGVIRLENMNSKKLKILPLCCIALVLFFQKLCFGHSWMAPEDAEKRNNPIKITTASINNGKALFIDRCSSCHGVEAVGVSKEKTGLKKDTPNLSNQLKTHSEGDFHWKIMNGKGDMPPFKDELSEKEVWDIINYIKTRIKK